MHRSWNTLPDRNRVQCERSDPLTWVRKKSMCETGIIIINVETVVLIFRIVWWIESSQEQDLFEIEIFCNIKCLYRHFLSI